MSLSEKFCRKGVEWRAFVPTLDTMNDMNTYTITSTDNIRLCGNSEFQVETFALIVMTRLNISGWEVDFDNAKRRAGVCKYGPQVISFSRHFLANAPLDEIRNTVLHEIAHIIAGYDAGHGAEWVRVAQAIGCDGERCTTAPVATEWRYEFWCDHCDEMIAKRHRLNGRMANFLKGAAGTHTVCGSPVRLVDNGAK